MSSDNRPMYGGQAVIEGVMMRGPHHFAVAARRADGGVALTCEPVPAILRPAWQKLAFVRGAFALVDSMALGTKALFWAAKVAEAGIAPAAPETNRGRAADIAIGGALFGGLGMAVVLFKILPQFGIEALKRAGVPVDWRLGLLDTAVRLTIIFSYISFVGRMAHVRRVFQYHGAEHKAINALEAGDPLTVEAVLKASRLHPRCGTSFLFIVVILSVFAAVPFYGQPLWVRIPLQLAMLFPVAGVSFELLRLSGKYRSNPVMAAISRPGMWTQLLTTREPDAAMCEIAIASLKAVLGAEKDPQGESPAADVA